MTIDDVLRTAATALTLPLLTATRRITIVIAAIALALTACSPTTATLSGPDADPPVEDEAADDEATEEQTDTEVPDESDEPPDEATDPPPLPRGPTLPSGCHNALPPGPC